MSITNTGTGDSLQVINNSSTDNAVVDIATITKDTSGTSAAGIGAGLIFDIEDAGGSEEQGSIDVSLTTVTDGSEDADMVFSLNQGGTITEIARLDGSADSLAVSGEITVPATSGIDVVSAGLLDIGVNTATSIGYGSGSVTAHTFTSDGTGDSEISLPADSIGASEIDSTTGAYDFGGVTSLEIPNADGPTVNAAGEIGVDTNSGAAGNIDQGVITYYDGTQQMYGVAVDAEPSNNDNILALSSPLPFLYCPIDVINPLISSL